MLGILCFITNTLFPPPSSSMTTEYTNADAQQPLIPEQQEASDVEVHDRSDEAEEVVPNPFTREDATQLLSFDGTSCTIPPNTFTAIGNKAFGSEFGGSEFNLLETVIIPDSITSIGAESFHYCEALKTINLPNTITFIGDAAFYRCSALASINLPDSITSIGRSAFAYCSTLSSVTIPNSITEIKVDTFHNCFSLATITIPDSLTTVGAYAFFNCSSLKSIIVPDAALNNTNYGMWGGTYYDPFRYCTEPLAISAALNMNVKEFLLHQNQVKRDRIIQRVALLFCLKTINAERMLAGEEERTFSWDEQEDIKVGELKGVLAEKKIKAFELWREIAMFL